MRRSKLYSRLKLFLFNFNDLHLESISAKGNGKIQTMSSIELTVRILKDSVTLFSTRTEWWQRLYINYQNKVKSDRHENIFTHYSHT